METIRNIVVLLLVGWGSFAWSASKFVEPISSPPYRFLELDPSNRLYHLSMAIEQGPRGFVWFGTQSGLYRFDGTSLENMSDHLNAPSSFIYSLYLDSRSRLWVGTEYGAAYYDFKLDLFVDIDFGLDISIKPKVFDFVETGSGVLLGTSDGLFVATDGKANTFDGLQGKTIRTVAVDDLDRIWVGTEREGLLVQAKTGFESFLPNQGSTRDWGNYVRELMFDADGRLWVATYDGGVIKIDVQSSTVQGFDDPDLGENSHARALLQDASGNVWIGSDNGLHRWSASEGLQSVASEKIGLVYDLKMDDSGSIWISTFAGIMRFNPKFNNLKRIVFEGLDVDGPISSFAEMLNGEVAVGTSNGVARWNTQTGEIVDVLSRMNGFEAFVTALEFSANDGLWIGTYARGLYRWQSGELFGPFDTPDGDFRRHGITDLHDDSLGDLWLATAGAGIFKVVPDPFSFVRYPDESNLTGTFPDLQCLAIREDKDGFFWVATNDSGPFRFDPQTGTTFDYSALGLERKGAYLATSDLGVWFGSYTGELHLLKEHRGSLEELSLDTEKLYSIYGMQFVEDILFLASSKKIYIYDHDGSTSVSLDDRNNVVPEINQGASAVLSSGYALFGGGHGFNIVSLSNTITTYDYQPEVIARSIFINHQPYRESLDLLELNYSQRDLVLNFTITDYLFPGKQTSKYILEGFDQDWIDNGTSRAVTYTNLDPGSYMLRVRGTNSAGIWSENELALPIVISPPWWATWWAYTLYVAVALLFFYQMLQLSARRVSLQAEGKFNQRLRHYVSALDDAAECVLNATETGRVLYVNDAIRGVLGKPVSSAIGHSLFDVLFDDESTMSSARELLESEGRYLDEVVYEVNNEPKVLEISIRKGEERLEDDVAFVCVVRDVTERSARTNSLKNQVSILEDELTRISDELEVAVRESDRFKREAQVRIDTDEGLLNSFHDRVNDNFQMLTSLFSIQAAKATNEAVVRVLDDNQQRIKSIALIHEQLLQTEQLNKVSMAEYVDVLVTSLYRRLAPSHLQLGLTKDISDVSLSIDQAVPAGLLLNELVSNAFVHAFKHKTHRSGHVRVSFYELAGECVVLVSDDGMGLPADFQLEKHVGVGFEIVSILSKQLGGSFKLVGGIGTTFEVRFPIASLA